MERFRNWQKGGFTLVELALVLVIIGLLITGVLKGEALIQNAKVKKVVNQKDSLTAAFYTYYDRYNWYPGDAPATVTDIPITGHTDNGNGNGQIDANNERWVLYYDLVQSQIINGGYTGVANDVPTNPFGGTAIIQYYGTPPGSATPLNANCIVFTQMPYDVAQEMDRKYDDGVYNTGTMRANTVYTATTVKTIYWRM